MSRMIELPFDVEEHIIGSLDDRDDAGTIANCALVCRQWLLFSRPKLYRRVTLDHRQQWTSFQRLVLQPPSGVKRYSDRVRDIYIRPCGNELPNGERDQARAWAHLALIYCAGRLPGLVHIELRAVDWSQRRVHAALRSGTTYCSLTTLDLQSCTFASITQLHVFVTAFPALSDLTLQSVQFQSQKTRILEGGHLLTRLKLSASDDTMMILSQWLARAQLVQNLTHLHWQTSNKVAENAWDTLSEAINGPSLQSLVLYADRSWRANHAQFENLKTFEFHFDTWDMIDEHIKPLNQALSSIYSVQLEELRVHYRFEHAVLLSDMIRALTNLQDTLEILAHPRFGRLCHFVLEYELFINTPRGHIDPGYQSDAKQRIMEEIKRTYMMRLNTRVVFEIKMIVLNLKVQSLSDAPHHIYARKLIKLKLGHPLWCPEPIKLGEPMVGDVGYIVGGAFHRVFNVLRDSEDPVNSRGVPDSFEPLRLPPTAFRTTEQSILPGPLLSEKLKMQELDTTTLTFDDESPESMLQRFRCNGVQGAILILRHSARLEEVIAEHEAVGYMRSKWWSWSDFAQSKLNLDIASEGMILVTGCTKTAPSWSTVTIIQNDMPSTVKFDDRTGHFRIYEDRNMTLNPGMAQRVAPSMAQRHCQWPRDQRRGNPPPELTRNHCVFLKYYRSRWRLFVPKFDVLPPPNRNNDEENKDPSAGSAVEATSPLSKAYDPVDYVVDYILEESNAEFAIASIDGLYAACPDEVPDDIEQFLRETKPEIYVTKSGTGILCCEPDMGPALMAEDEEPTTAEGEHTKMDAETEIDTESSLSSSAESSPYHLPHELPEGAAEEQRDLPSGEDVLANLPDASHITSANPHSCVQIWDAQSDQEIACLERDKGLDRTHAFEPYGQWTVPDPNNDPNRDTYKSSTVPGHMIKPNSPASFSPDGQHAYAPPTDGTVFPFYSVDESERCTRTLDGGSFEKSSNASQPPFMLSTNGSKSVMVLEAVDHA